MTPHDDLTAFEQRLLRALGDERARMAPRPGRTRRRVRMGLWGGATAAALGLSVAAAVWPDGGGGGAPVPGLGPQPATAAQVSARTIASVERVAKDDHVILHTVQVTGDLGGDTGDAVYPRTDESWEDTADPRNARSAIAGNDGRTVALETATRVVGGCLDRIDHEIPTRSVTLTTGACDPTHTPVSTPDIVRRNLEGGDLVLVGTTTERGREAYHLRARPGIAEGWEYWVDTRTNLPLRFSEYGGRVTMRYEWLPRTKANLALLWPAIPAGTDVTRRRAEATGPSRPTPPVDAVAPAGSPAPPAPPPGG